MTGARFAQLVGSCVVLAVGVTLLLRSALGSDGYSTFVNGLALSTGTSFALVNLAVGAVLVGLAWCRGLRPGVGTVVQQLVVGLGVAGGLQLLDEPTGLGARALLMVLALPVLAVGVAGYLNTASGAGPAEVAALALEPALPFRWGYNLLQATGALVGWLCGADVGPGTLLVVLALGPAVDRCRAALPSWQEPAGTV